MISASRGSCPSVSAIDRPLVVPSIGRFDSRSRKIIAGPWRCSSVRSELAAQPIIRRLTAQPTVASIRLDCGRNAVMARRTQARQFGAAGARQRRGEAWREEADL